jgi:S1-C subfamily serine protease
MCKVPVFRTSAAILLGFASLTAAAAQSKPPVSSKELTVAEIVRRSSGAVVQVVVSDEAGKEISLGSGFIVSTDGMIVTNFHVIQNAHSAVAKLADGSFMPVEGVAAVDADKDLAVLKVNGKGLPSLKLTSIARLHVGDHVVAIGSPLGFEGTVSDGIVSALRTEAPGKNWIQTTAPVSHGNSGGPLLDMDGGVIGVITWGVDLQQGENLNFAIPSDVVESLVSSTHDQLSFDAVRSIHGASSTSAPPNEASHDHQKAQSMVDDGLKEVEAKHYEQAIHTLKDAIHIDPENADAWHALGVAHSFLGQIDESVVDFKEAVKYAPAYEGYWVSLGLGYRWLSKHEEALSALQEAVGIDPSDATAWLYLGKTFDALHNYDQSLRCYRNATQNRPDYAEAWYELGIASKNENEAISALNRAVAIRPNYADAWYFLGSKYNTLKQYDKAIAAWKNELDLKSTDAIVSDARIWHYIASAYYYLNDFKNAEQADQKALDLAYHTNPTIGATHDNMLIPSICQSLSLTYDKMGKHRQSDYYDKTFIYLMQHPN